MACVDSNFVSSVGEKVTEFEQRVAEFAGARFGVAVVNGTNALAGSTAPGGRRARLRGADTGADLRGYLQRHCLHGCAAGIRGCRSHHPGDEPRALRTFLESHGERRDGGCYNRTTGRRIAACQPMHTFGHPCRISEIASICSDWGIPLVEDAAESLGSSYREQHTGTFGQLGVFSFNGNKIITTGGGGMIVTDDEALARRAKHLTTTAKVPHAYEYVHDELGYNFRMPNLNAALGCAQMDQLAGFLAVKREIAARYAAFCTEHARDRARGRPVELLAERDCAWLQGRA